MSRKKNAEEDLRAELEELKIRFNETEETLNAIRRGEVDAIVVSGENGDKIFSITSSETPYRIIIENMDEVQRHPLWHPQLLRGRHDEAGRHRHRRRHHVRALRGLHRGA